MMMFLVVTMLWGGGVAVGVVGEIVLMLSWMGEEKTRLF